jgi:AcrR family transcriptional regulator
MAWDLLLSEGFEAFSLKAVAEKCGIGRSNVYYYFKNKEDLLIALYHHLIEEFLKKVEKIPIHQSDPWVKFIMVNYAYLLTVFCHDTFREGYIETTRSPEMRARYIEINNNLFLSFVDADELGLDYRDIFLSSVSASGAEFEILDLCARRSGEIGLDYALTYPFKVRLHLLNVPHKQIDVLIRKGMECGKTLYGQLGAIGYMAY